MRFELYVKQALATESTPGAALSPQMRDDAAIKALIASGDVRRPVMPIRHRAHHKAGSSKVAALPDG